MFGIPDSVPAQTYKRPFVMVGVDVALSNDNGKVSGHPRGAGSHARILAKFVRSDHVMARMTIMPAKRLEASVPQMRSKGRLQEGADADIVAFDPARVIDRATYEKPAQASEGIVHVLVNGTPVVRGGALLPNATPGVGIRRPKQPVTGTN